MHGHAACSTHPFLGVNWACRMFVSLSRVFLDDFLKFKRHRREHVKTMLGNPVTTQTDRRKIGSLRNFD